MSDSAQPKDNSEEVEFYRDLVEGIDHAVIWSATAPHLDFTFVSPRTSSITGFTPEDWLKEHRFFFHHIPIEDRPALQQLIEDALAGQERGINHRFIHREGRTLWFHTGMRRAKSSTSQEWEIRGLTVDVTEIVEAENRAHASEAKFRSLSESLPSIVFVSDPSGNTLYLNRRWYQYTGLPPEVRDRESWARAIHPDDKERVIETWVTARNLRHPWIFEYRLRRYDGVYRWHVGRSTPEISGSGDIIRWVGTATDIENQKAFQNRIIESERTLDQIFERSPSFLAILSLPDFKITKANSEFVKIVEQAEVVGKSILELIPETESRGLFKMLACVAETGESFNGTEVPVELCYGSSGQTKEMYLDFTCHALTRTNGEIFSIAVHGHDVTEKVISRLTLKLAKDAVELERENFRNLFRQTPEMVCILSGPEHTFEFVNESYVKALGFNATGLTLREAQPESVEVHGILDDVYRTGKTAELRETPVTVTDRVRYFNLTYSARRDEFGRVNGILILGNEITEQIEARQALVQQSEILEKSEQRYRLLTELSPQTIWTADAEGRITYANSPWYEYSGLTEHETLSNAWVSIVHPDDQERAKNGWLTALEEDRDFTIEIRIQRAADLEFRWHLVKAKAIKDSKGKISQWVGISADIHEGRKTHAQLQTVLDTIPIFAGVLNPKGTVKLINQMAVNAIEASTTDVLGKNFWDCTWWRNLPASHEKIMEAIRLASLGQTMRFDIQYAAIIGGQPQVRWVDLSLIPVKNDKGAVESLTTSGFDITDRIAMQKDLEIAKNEAERANELKSVFLANMSHEIRTPLGAMLGFTDLLRDTSLTPSERTNYVDILARNGEQLSVIINDILDLSKVEAGHVTLEFTDTFPEDISQDVVSLLSVKAKEKDLKLEYIKGMTTPPLIVTDRTRVRQVLLNLVANAIKFTSSGSVTLKSWGKKSTTGHDVLVFEIEDTGIGVPESQRDRVFEVFVQADGSMTRRFGGTGLGLALSRRLARALGGDVSLLKSKEGQGATFQFEVESQPSMLNEELPAPAQRNSTPISLKENTLEGVKVLVVDDATDNQQLILRYLKKYGALIESADNGLLGYRKALEGAFDIVLMDIQMPEMDGYTATQMLRNAGYFKPIIALTAHAMSEIRKKCLNVGCTDHLCKPINAKELVSAIAKHTGRLDKDF